MGRVVVPGVVSAASRSMISGGGGGTDGAGGRVVGGGGGIVSDVVEWIETSEASEPSELALEVEEGEVPRGGGAWTRPYLRGVVVVRLIVVVCWVVSVGGGE